MKKKEKNKNKEKTNKKIWKEIKRILGKNKVKTK
jgi:hypothetical protein